MCAVSLIKFNEGQQEAWRQLVDNQTEIILYGGQANSGKSWLAGFWLMHSALRYSGTRWGLCRKNLSDLKKTSLKTFLDVCKYYNVLINKDFTINNQTNTIHFKNGSEIYLINLEWRPSDEDGDFLGGLELTGCVIDELPQVSKKYFEVMYSRLRYKLDDYKLTKKLLCTCNPSSNWVKNFFWDRYKKNTLPPEVKFINTVNKKNIFRNKDYEKSLSQLSDSQYKRLELGDWDYNQDLDQLFDLQKIESIQKIKNNISDTYYISCDIARFGSDATIIVLWKGLEIIDIQKFTKTDLATISKNIQELANKYKIKREQIIVDGNGVGGGVVDNLKCKEFINNSRPLKNEKFDMLKTQCYFQLNKSEWFVSQTVKKEYVEQIVKEMTAIRDMSDEYKYKINSKDEQKRLLGSSPDFLDAIMMRMYYELKPNHKINFEFL